MSDLHQPGSERAYLEQQRDRLAGRALTLLVLLNGAAALALLVIMALASEPTISRKIAGAMLFFGGGAMAALLSSFIAYVNRTVRIEAPEKRDLRRVLRGLAIAAVIGSGTAFLIGLNMVATASAEKSSSHPKGPREDKKRKAPAIKNAKAEAQVRTLLRTGDLAGEVGPGLLGFRGQRGHSLADNVPIDHRSLFRFGGSLVEIIDAGNREQRTDYDTENETHGISLRVRGI